MSSTREGAVASARRTCDGAGLVAAFRAGVANLERHVDEVNALNVFPVPDGDTGSNMLSTVRSALDEAERVDAASADRVAGAISFGALMGARGNSGVITSQVFGGMATALGGKRRFNGVDLAFALVEGSDAAYRAVSRPVEGTILTVVREASEAARAAAELSPSIEGVLDAAVSAAAQAVAKTPALLPILRESNVVDAGGQGFFRFLEGALASLRSPVEAFAGPAAVPASAAPAESSPATPALAEEAAFGYETVFLVRPPVGRRLDLAGMRAYLGGIGESVLVAGDEDAARVHVHNERPDEVIAYGLSLGSLSGVGIENLDLQARQVREARNGHGDGYAPDVVPAESAETAIAAEGAAPEEGQPGPGPAPGVSVVAVVPGEGLARIYEELGADQLIRGGPAENPSIGDFLRLVGTAQSRDVVILPNHPSGRLAAEQVAALSRDRHVLVVPTRNAAEGIAALLRLDRTLDGSANAVPMADAARAVTTLQVTDAVRDATVSGRKVRRGQTIVLGPDEGLVAADGDREKAVLAAIRTLPPTTELVTLYYGDGADLAEAEAIGRRIGAELGGAEVEVVHGGQPHYRFLIAAE